MKRSTNYGLVEMSAEDIAAKEIEDKKWTDGAKDRKLAEIKKLRLQRLQATDYMANSDYTMPDYIKTWRQTLRDLPQNNTTESSYDTLLERNADKSLKNSVWTQPTS
jgi:hypothetical protein